MWQNYWVVMWLDLIMLSWIMPFTACSMVAADPAMHGITAILRFAGVGGRARRNSADCREYARRAAGLINSRFETLEQMPSRPHQRIDIAERRLEASRSFGAAHLLRLSGKLPIWL
jgi:hypothetical protein